MVPAVQPQFCPRRKARPSAQAVGIMGKTWEDLLKIHNATLKTQGVSLSQGLSTDRHALINGNNWFNLWAFKYPFQRMSGVGFLM